MSVQDIILNRPKLACWLLSKLPAAYWSKEGEKLACDIANQTIREVKAYQQFLSDHSKSIKSVSSIRDFETLPVMDKDNYIAKYKTDDTLIQNHISENYAIERSSGHSGEAQYWPRDAVVDSFFAKYIEIAFNQAYKISQKSSLVVLTFALGTWTTGEKTADALRKLAATGRYRLSVITPGANLAESVEILQRLSNQYDQTIIIGYPPFVRSIVDGAIEAGIDLSKLNIKIGLGGEGHSLFWKKDISKKLHISSNDLTSISSAYGAADVGIGIGREYPISILIRQLASDNKKLANDLFGQSDVLPGLYQFNNSSYVEAVNGELIFTAMNGIPVVRYNIHDRGGVIKYNQMLKILLEHGIDIRKMLQERHYTSADVWRLPFFYVFGRTDGTISFGGANIYPENIENALISSNQSQLVSAFKLGVEKSKSGKECLVVHIELKQKSSVESEGEKKRLATTLHQVVVEKLKEINTDYSDVYQFDPKSADIEIRVCDYGTSPFMLDNKKIKRNYLLK
ncbi:MAG: hypothetical protein WC773_03920 [Patescibacteria group bacterium]|jgi:phenylacetate-CoA ligase